MTQDTKFFNRRLMLRALPFFGAAVAAPALSAPEPEQSPISVELLGLIRQYQAIAAEVDRVDLSTVDAHIPEELDDRQISAANALFAYRCKEMAEVRQKADFIASNKYLSECAQDDPVSCRHLLLSMVSQGSAPAEMIATDLDIDTRIAHQVEILKTLLKVRYPQIDDWRVTLGATHDCPVMIAAFSPLKGIGKNG